MEENRLFQFVWRFNGIVIMASAILTLASLIFFVGGEILSNRDRQNTKIANVDRNMEIKKELEIDSYWQVVGTPHLIFSLKSQQSYSCNLYSSNTSSNRTYLFVDSKNDRRFDS